MADNDHQARLAAELQEHEALQAKEYGTYIANGPIYIGGALAFAEGHPVPVSTVEANKYVEQKLVREVGTDAPPAPAAAETAVGDPIVLNDSQDEHTTENEV